MFVYGVQSVLCCTEILYSTIGANVVDAREDVVATKLGIILSFSSFSMHILLGHFQMT